MRGFVHILLGVSVSLMADTVFKADFRGSCTLDPTGLKEDDSSVEIYVENKFNKETTHTTKLMQTHPHTPTREDKYKHMHIKRTAQVRAQTTERQKTRVNITMEVRNMETV